MKAKIKNLPHMKFVKREIHTKTSQWAGADWITYEIWDYFQHEYNILLIRKYERVTSPTYKSQRVNWYCPEFGSGHASIDYWLMKARKKPGPHGCKSCRA